MLVYTAVIPVHKDALARHIIHNRTLKRMEEAHLKVLLLLFFNVLANILALKILLKIGNKHTPLHIIYGRNCTYRF